MTKRFALVMPDNLYNEFYRLFPDHGRRTSILRRCVYRMVQQARLVGSDMVDPTRTADRIQEEEKEREE